MFLITSKDVCNWEIHKNLCWADDKNSWLRITPRWQKLAPIKNLLPFLVFYCNIVRTMFLQGGAMIKHLQKIGNSKGIVLDKPILKLLQVDEKTGAFEVLTKDGGLFLKPVNIKKSYQKIAKKHRKSLDKLGNA